ncbi:alanine racemase [Streptomyces sp. NBC_01429]|uniref:alanine racemase n=1 Tax=Streptomyces sp. NBC_01429 TaxID=2903862 RepID=UPI002E2D2214|nr:alanine racemase [Streptomyces sp. NBC_01429]
MNALPLYLEPRVEPRPAALLRADGFTHDLVDALGSPLNIVLPDQIADNLDRFRATYRGHQLGGQVYFAHKANRSSALLRRLAATDAGVDVASLGELQHALGAGFAPGRIMATGPKNPAFLWLAARTGVTVNVDSLAELDALGDLVRTRSLPRVRTVLRLSAFGTGAAPGSGGVKVLSRASRFGSPVGALDELIKSADRHREAIELIGVGFHLDTTSVAEKALALEGCVSALGTLREHGFSPHVVDTGGGFGVSYLAHREQWERYTSALTQSVLGQRPAMTWRGYGYGLRNDAGTLRGSLGLYPAHRATAGEGYLDELLSSPASATPGRPLSALLLENLFDLYTEPGRALVDQCGLILARVLEVRRDGTGPYLVRLEAKADDIGLEEHGVFMDPVVIGRGGAAPAGDGDAVGVYLAGGLCLEADLISRRTVFLPSLPNPGDLLGFVNTAGYCMDFRTSHAQRLPAARAVAAWQDGDLWRWSLDEQYWPTLSQGGQA